MSMRSGQLRDFMEVGFKVPEELGCTAGSPDSWSAGVDGKPKPCCLMMTEVVGKSAPLRFTHFPGRVPTATASGIATCPALQHYGPHPSETFICPLAYATV